VHRELRIGQPVHHMRLGAVDANHVGAHITQHHRAHRAGTDSGQLDDRQSREWTRHDFPPAECVFFCRTMVTEGFGVTKRITRSKVRAASGTVGGNGMGLGRIVASAVLAFGVTGGALAQQAEAPPPKEYSQQFLVPGSVPRRARACL
jgi:hypothetical protein